MAIKVLTVDDSKVVRMIVARAFKPYDSHVLEASNGLEGLEVAIREKPDLVILDVTMPIMTGLEMLRKLRIESGLTSVPVIMLTAEASQDRISEADSLGISGYLAKPFKEEQLVEEAKRTVQLSLK